MRALSFYHNAFKSLPVFWAASVLVGITSSAMASPATTDEVTKQAVELCRQGKDSDAQQAALRAVSEHPNDWYPHAVLSYIDWRRGQVIPALTEAQVAGKLAPNEGSVFANVGLFNETLCRYDQSIQAFDWARTKMPDNFVPWIGLARCFAIGSDSKDATSVLTYMATQKGKSFEWYHQAGQAYLDIDAPGLAIAPLAKAAALATTIEQQSDCATKGLLAVLRDNQEERGRCIAEGVINKYDPKVPELYIRTASVAAPLNRPSIGAHFLQVASNHLRAAADSDIFLKVGRVYERKAIATSLDKSVNRQWLVYAADAYRQAIVLDPQKGSYHRALAGVLDRQSNFSEMRKELAAAASLDPDDKLASYFLANEACYPSHLSEVRFRVEGMCACKISSMKPALEKVKGVLVAHVNPALPISATILIDRSLTPISQACDEMLKNLFGDNRLANPVNFTVYSCEPVEHVADAIDRQQDFAGGIFDFGPRIMARGVPIAPFELATAGEAKSELAGGKTPK
jgi:tetratricopeptide (TPR) repeat protein